MAKKLVCLASVLGLCFLLQGGTRLHSVKSCIDELGWASQC
ncbi:hypothetical protein BX589_12996 [Paraburkholderia fungorum]|jgi:hypothetical protein|nr:hypothetical protein BX589_12996 [Paraburkholderia fungorum]